ncbi:YciI family protein [Clostridium brassicae]|uniref:YCII-related domain-containing protein n=1 Tax=Clostridium brassicae TaxID=2999072 RepID=A0ABT4D783_9CLOT|nr:hypothetical protein [Clostridium brassicae]MCY6958138.1 hypothetical protein [Clostridium brassicae]
MQDGSNFFVRVNYSIERDNSRENNRRAYIRNITDVNEGRYLIGGGFFTKDRGSFVFKAKTLKEANEIAKNNIFIKNKYCKYELIILDNRVPLA